ncbi:uncharacterized protein Dwil_GK15821 [Drosophila willistoni]|uniref:Uncharacterized protein n=1 Tax=Drosophila willistoni TaxID=7260 RepID=B4MRF5_DROWI|nr:uncharacterized protein LOC6641079 [Drosophila willistoni]EDW74694.1 uncharacterized protein Dwil_GK15821 [Drosophila willistoni]
MSTIRSMVSLQHVSVRDPGLNQRRRNLVYLPPRRRPFQLQYSKDNASAESKRPPRLLIKNFLSIRNLEERSILPVPRHLWERIMTVSQPIFQPHRTLLDDRNRWTDFMQPLVNDDECKRLRAEVRRREWEVPEPDLDVHCGLGMNF